MLTFLRKGLSSSGSRDKKFPEEVPKTVKPKKDLYTAYLKKKHFSNYKVHGAGCGRRETQK